MYLQDTEVALRITSSNGKIVRAGISLQERCPSPLGLRLCVRATAARGDLRGPRRRCSTAKPSPRFAATLAHHSRAKESESVPAANRATGAVTLRPYAARRTTKLWHGRTTSEQELPRQSPAPSATAAQPRTPAPLPTAQLRKKRLCGGTSATRVPRGKREGRGPRGSPPGRSTPAPRARRAQSGASRPRGPAARPARRSR